MNRYEQRLSIITKQMSNIYSSVPYPYTPSEETPELIKLKEWLKQYSGELQVQIESIIGYTPFSMKESFIYKPHLGSKCNSKHYIEFSRRLDILHK